MPFMTIKILLTFLSIVVSEASTSTQCDPRDGTCSNDDHTGDQTNLLQSRIETSLEKEDEAMPRVMEGIQEGNEVSSIQGGSAMSWILAKAGQSCSQACADVKSTCDASALSGVSSGRTVMDAATKAGKTCKRTIGWGYSFSPSICTSPRCCGNGACTGWCTYGNNGKRSCNKRTWGHHSRLCPCKAKATTTTLPPTTQAPTTQAPPPPDPVGPKLDGLDKNLKDSLQKLKDYIKNKQR